MKNRIHLICNAHLDPVWQWRWTEGCSEAIATFRNAAEILDEYPELIFNHNEAILYQWVEKYDPQLFTRIRQLVSDGRWFISGGWYLQPDVNLPPYGNLVRHIRFGREYFKSRFGVEPVVAYNFDSFGHPSTLPALLRDHGYKFYVHQRPESEHLTLPDSLYLWKGFGGISIPAYRIEIGLYHSERKNIVNRLQEATDLALKLGRDVALFWGLGNHGGGATRIDLDRIREFQSAESRVEIIHSTTDRFYEAIEPLVPNLPLFEGSLQRVFAGCYTSLSRIKRRALETSYAAEQAESLQPVTSNLQPATCNPQPLTSLWHDILFNDFHDILPGTCTAEAEQDALDLYGRAMENIRSLNLESITRINRESQPLKGHIPLTVYQSDPDLADFPVEFECMSDYRPFWDGDRPLILSDRNGNTITSQEEEAEARLPFFRWRRKVVFMAKGWGAGVKHLMLEPSVQLLNDIKTITQSEGEQGGGNPLSQVLSMKFLAVHDRADSWGTGAGSWREVAGVFGVIIPERVIESGPVRTIFETVYDYNRSRIILHRIKYADWPVQEFRARIHWNEEQLRLKWCIDTDMPEAELFAEIPGGWETFGADGQERVHGTWMELVKAGGQEGKKKKGIGLVHNGMHGFDFSDGEIRFSVLRSAAYCHEQGYNLDNGRMHRFMDQGVHEVRLAITETDREAGTPSVRHLASLARWINAPALAWPHLPVGAF